MGGGAPDLARGSSVLLVPGGGHPAGGSTMKDLADELVVAEMARLARARYGVEDLLETECERDLESRVARLKEAQ